MQNPKNIDMGLIGVEGDVLLSELTISPQVYTPAQVLTPQIQVQQSAPLTGVIYDLLRDNYQMADSVMFLKTGSLSISTTSFMTIVSFTMPQSAKGVLKFFGQGATTSAAFDDLTWQLTINNVPVIDLGGFTTQLGSISSPKQMTIRLKSNDIVVLAAKKTAITYTANGLLQGWYWSI